MKESLGGGGGSEYGLFGCVQQDLLYKHYSHKLMQGLVSH